MRYVGITLFSLVLLYMIGQFIAWGIEYWPTNMPAAVAAIVGVICGIIGLTMSWYHELRKPE